MSIKRGDDGTANGGVTKVGNGGGTENNKGWSVLAYMSLFKIVVGFMVERVTREKEKTNGT